MTKKQSDTDAKGRLVEDIAALLHRGTGVEVKTRVKLPARHDPTRTAEIDVLLDTQAADYPIRLAIECKNEKKPIGVEKVRSFIDKLNDVGISPSLGIYITAGRYTKGAIGRAKEVGLRLLELRGLTSDRLAAAVEEALHTLVFLVPELQAITKFDDVRAEGPDWYPKSWGHAVIAPLPESVSALEAILNYLWRLWMEKRIPHAIGEYHHSFDLPPCRLLPRDRAISQGVGLITTVKVTAIVWSFPAKARRFVLLDAESKELQRFHVDTHVDDAGAGLVRARVFETEDALADYLGEGPNVKLTTRVALPRVQHQAIYWPVSQQARERVRRLKAEGKPIDFENVEGFDLMKAWEHFE